MNEFFPFIIVGLATGSVYSLAGVGLVLTYKISGIFNFAYGSVAALAAFLFYFLRQQEGLPLAAAIPLCCVASVVLALLLERLARTLGQAPTTTRVVATVGIILVVLAAGTLLYPGAPRIVNSFLPTTTVAIDGVYVGWDQIITVTFSIAATALLYWFFRWSRHGIAMRAVVDNPNLLARTGISPTRVRQWAWMIGTAFAAISGISLAPTLGLDALTLTLLVTQAFGAAAIGRFVSLPMTYVGGLLLGVAGALCTKYTANYPSLGGLSPALPFIVLFVVLIVTRRSKLTDPSVRAPSSPSATWHAPARARTAAVVLVFGLAALVPMFAGLHIDAWSSLLVTMILLLSLGLLVRTSGQVSLCHMGFAAVGAAAMAHFTYTLGLPWLIAILLASLAAVPVGALVAIPAIRLPGVFLAVATLGFGVLLEQLIYPMSFMFTTDQSGIPTPRPSGGIGAWQFGSDIGFFYVLLLFALGTVATMALIVKGPLGRILKAMSYSRIALETGGLSTRTPQMLVFCISAFFASLSGALAASLANFAVGTSFPSFQSLIIFAVVVVTAIGEPWYAIIGAAGLALIPSYVTSPNAAVYLQLVFGIAAVGYVFSSARPLTVPLLVRRLADRLDGAFRRTPSPAQTTSATTLVPRRSKGEGLVVRNLTVQYGAVIAINDLSLDVPLGKITALIGPNGAGKTSTFNACSALIKPRSGIFEIGGMNISTFSSPKRARAGLGRGFQQPQLYDGLSVAENVRMGREAPLSGRNVVRQMMSGGKSQRAISASASEAMRLVGIEKLADTDCGLLSAGQRRLTELARCLAGDFDVLLLDEPSAGLDRRETALFAEVLKKAVRERNIGILIVEHDMDLVLGISDRIHVVDFGVKIFEGSPDEVMTSDTVRKAYLGTMLAGQS